MTKNTEKSTPKLPRGRPKDTAKREDIVRAAVTLFLKDGYELTSVDAVARKANVSKLTIYSHFENKDELFKAAIQQRCNERAMPETLMALANTPVEQALTQIGNQFSKLFYSPEALRFHRIMQAEAVRRPKVVQIFYEAGPKRVRAAMCGLMQSWHDRGELDIPDVARATEQFISLLKGELMMKTIMRLVPMPSPDELEKHVAASVAFFLAAYRPHSSKGDL